MSDYPPYRPDPLSNDFGSIPYEPPPSSLDQARPEPATPYQPAPPTAVYTVAPPLLPPPAAPPPVPTPEPWREAGSTGGAGTPSASSPIIVQDSRRPEAESAPEAVGGLPGWVKLLAAAFVTVLLLGLMSAGPDVGDDGYDVDDGTIVPSLSQDAVVLLPADTGTMTVEVTGPDRTASIYVLGLDADHMFSDVNLPLEESITITRGRTITITAIINGAAEATPVHCRVLVDGEVVSEATEDQAVECRLSTSP